MTGSCYAIFPESPNPVIDIQLAPIFYASKPKPRNGQIMSQVIRRNHHPHPSPYFQTKVITIPLSGSDSPHPVVLDYRAAQGANHKGIESIQQCVAQMGVRV